MTVFNIFYKARLGPNLMESVIAETEEEAITKFKKDHLGAEISIVTRPNNNRR